MGRSLRLSPSGKNQVEQALINKKWSVGKLAAEIGVAISTAKNFRAGKPIDRNNFALFCESLGLDWEIVYEKSINPPESPIDRSSKVSEESIAPSKSPIDQPPTSSQSEEIWIEQVREHCRQRILSQHSRMRLLSGEEIGVDQLYVDVWLLNRSPRTFQVSAPKLLKTFDLRNDRLGLGDRIKRNPGFEVANNKPKLVILGKPGAGKTTFLKHLAVDWCNSKFQPDSIAVLIELRRIRNERWDLTEAIGKESGLKGQQQIVTLLEQGKFLVLMDGLDEIPDHEIRRDVKNQLEQIAKDYPKNRLFVTCRTQIIGAIPVGFTSVEVADFSKEQVQKFVQNWSVADGNSSAEALQEWEKFDHTINHNSALQELTTTPVLLSLMCLVLHDEGKIPEQRDELYRKGINLLLSKWNEAKEIDDWQIGTETYQQLNIEQKLALLTEIAARKFENPENFVLFQQDEIAAQITQFLKLAESRDGVAVLKAIEAHHGLLIERADELWSFSHLTFQEYFTVQWLTRLSPEHLIQKIASQKWQKAVKQIVTSQQPADRLVYLIKQAINQSIANESKLQEFLAWVLQESDSIQTTRKLASARRAFYFSYVYTLDPLALSYNLSYAGDELNLVRNAELNLTLTLARAFNLIPILVRAFNFALERELNLTLDRALVLTYNHNPNTKYFKE